MSDSHHLDRSGFVKIILTVLGSIMGFIMGLPAIVYLISPATRVQESEAWIPLGPLTNYPIGEPTLFNFTRSKINGWEKTVNSYGAYVIRGENDEIQVLSNMCTHLSCRVTWQEEGQDYLCPCHDGHFGKYGEVLSGPPPKPLENYEAKIEEGNLFIHFVEG